MGGGVRWEPIRGRPNIIDRREAVAVRDVADAVDGSMSTPPLSGRWATRRKRQALAKSTDRCARCKNGKLPDGPLRVTVLTVFGSTKTPLVTISCPDCRRELSYSSARKLNHALVIVVRYE
jgi:hypothetical protein